VVVAGDDMARKIIESILHLISAIALIWGISLLMAALAMPGQYRLFTASAPQITQVYTEATYYAVEACAMFLLALLLQFAIFAGKSAQGTSPDTLDAISKNTEETNRVLRQLGKVLVNRQ
jgi:hypothetical protein